MKSNYTEKPNRSLSYDEVQDRTKFAGHQIVDTALKDQDAKTASFYQSKIEELDALRIRLANLEKKLDDREADLVNARKEEREQLLEVIAEDFVEMVANFYMTDKNRVKTYELWEQIKHQALKGEGEYVRTK